MQSIGVRLSDRDILAGVVLLLLAVALAVVKDAPPAAAAVACGSEGNYFDGFYHDTVGHPTYDFEGSSAYIVVRNSGACTGAFPIFSNAWVMIASGNGTPGAGGWGQMGFVRHYGVNQNPTRWGRSASSCTAFDIWTR